MINMRDFLKPILVTLGVLLVIIGLLTFPLPIPVGALFLIIGLFILISTSYTAVLVIRRLRNHHKKLDQWLRDSESKMPHFLQKTLRRTDPS